MPIDQKQSKYYPPQGGYLCCTLSIVHCILEVIPLHYAIQKIYVKLFNFYDGDPVRAYVYF